MTQSTGLSQCKWVQCSYHNMICSHNHSLGIPKHFAQPLTLPQPSFTEHCCVSGRAVLYLQHVLLTSLTILWALSYIEEFQDREIWQDDRDRPYHQFSVSHARALWVYCSKLQRRFRPVQEHLTRLSISKAFCFFRLSIKESSFRISPMTLSFSSIVICMCPLITVVRFFAFAYRRRA